MTGADWIRAELELASARSEFVDAAEAWHSRDPCMTTEEALALDARLSSALARYKAAKAAIARHKEGR